MNVVWKCNNLYVVKVLFSVAVQFSSQKCYIKSFEEAWCCSVYITPFTQPGWTYNTSLMFSHMIMIKVCLLDSQAPTTTAHVRLKWWTNKKSFCLLDFCCLPTWSRWAEATDARLVCRQELLRDVDKVRSLYVMSVWCPPSSENKKLKKRSACSLVSVVHFPFIFTTNKRRPCALTEATSYVLHDKHCG